MEIWEDQAEFDSLRQRIAELEALAYVPGLWKCARCGFHLVQTSLDAASGTVNCDVPLWRVTEREAGREMERRCEALVLENQQLRQALGAPDR